MKIVERIILAVGAATLVVLLVKLDPASVWGHLGRVGWGMALLIPLHFADHLINASAWKVAFNPREGASVRFWSLVKVRIAGDGVNYLTPSATIAGEVVRPGMLGDEVSAEARVASVVVAKFTQSLGQALFILSGILFIAAAKIPVADSFKGWFYAAVACLTAVFTALVLYAALARSRAGREAGLSAAGVEDGPPGKGWSLKSFKRQMGSYFLSHPGRFIGSVLLFCLGYVWGAVEAYLICRFLGLAGVTAAMAYAIEVLSSAVDGAFFMVPAKVGTTEAGKTAIFAGLGYPAATGFAFGVVRHVRELVWAGFGFALFTLHRRARRGAAAPAPSRPEEPAVCS